MLFVMDNLRKTGLLEQVLDAMDNAGSDTVFFAGWFYRILESDMCVCQKHFTVVR